ncbi:hypothetical protein BDZ91DRAFT_715145 [Kalaharituber pfeilii]|nr:hypothetical protein BDZ91DRAFT_715145 [Kalaharituber pfeilii]
MFCSGVTFQGFKPPLPSQGWAVAVTSIITGEASQLWSYLFHTFAVRKGRYSKTVVIYINCVRL